MEQERTKLQDISIQKVFEQIESTQKEDRVLNTKDMVVTIDEKDTVVLQHPDFPEESRPITQFAQTQMNQGLCSGFGSYARYLMKEPSRENKELYAYNATKLLEKFPDDRLIRFSTYQDEPTSMRAWLSPSYKVIDNDLVFGSLLDSIEGNQQATEFMAIGGYHTGITSYVKLITKDPLFSITADGRERAFHPGFILSNSEVGQGYCKLEVLLVDRYCTNGCIFSKETLGDIRMMHRGTRATVGGILPNTDQMNLDQIRRRIQDAVSIAFNKDLYLGFREAVQSAADMVIDITDDTSVDLWSKHIGRTLALTEGEQKAVAQRIKETGDRSLFGVQAAITEEAKYASTYDRKLELERAGAKVFTEVPRRMNTLKNLVAAEALEL